jgi:hypothetical protein
VNVQIGKRPALTLGICTLPNRGTLVTVSVDESHAVRIRQFILPLGHLASQLPFGGGFGAPGRDELRFPLRVVRRLVEVQRAFERSRRLDQVFSQPELDELLSFKWFEPVVSLLSAYELVRREQHAFMPEVVGNLQRHFPQLPDTGVLAGVCRLPTGAITAPPLVLDGYEAIDLHVPGVDTPPTERLDFTGPWTLWSGAVR